MSEVFDVVVIGAGPAGENAAGRCAAGGLSVAIVERELVGGECAYWGCIPSKALLRPGDALAAAGRVPGAARAAADPVDVAAALAWRDRLTGGWRDGGQLHWLAERGIELIRGHGRLAGERVVAVERDDGSVPRVTARHAVVIATGTAAVMPPIPGLREVEPWDNRDVTAVKELPGRLLVLGGGTIGCEMAQALRRLGRGQVTVVEALERLLAQEEPFAGAQVRDAFEAEGITVLTGVRMTAARRDSSGVVAALDDGRQLAADELLVAVGRRPATGDLGLDTVGLEPGRFIPVDGQLRVPGHDWLYAVGDCNGRALLTHMGKHQARLAGDVILGKKVTDLAVVPRVTFTDPQVCAVGLTEAQARERGMDVVAVETPTGGVAGASTMGEGIGGTSKLVICDDLIVGATFTGPGVAELLHSATIAIVGEVPMSRLWHAVPSFPTISEVWLRLMEAYGL
ncbi:MAG: dihydrolipoyl dehydrogenase family protein [Egibacteraceae bacterium]